MGHDGGAAAALAARELVERHGAGAKDYAAERVRRLESEAAWPEHATASLVLSEVERLLSERR